MDAASRTDGHDRHVEIFWVRWVARAPVSEWWVGAAVAGALSALTYLAWVSADRVANPASFLDRLPYTIALTIGYLLAGIPYGIRKVRGDLEELRPHLDCSAEALAAAEARLSRLDRRLVWLLLAAAVATPALIQELIAGRTLRIVTGPALDAWELWSLLLPVPLWFTLFTTMALGLTQMRVMRSMGLHHLELGLFDREPVRPIVRFALRLAGLAVAAPLVLVAVSLAANAADAGSALATSVVGSGIATLEVLAPLSGVRQRILAAKRAELARIEPAIRESQRALLGSSDVEGNASQRLVGLLAYRREVEAVPGWPLDAPALRRFGLYLVLPLASWVAAALVERLVDRLLQ